MPQEDPVQKNILTSDVAFVLDTMREMSRQTDPNEMVRAYSRRMGAWMQTDGFVSISRRSMPAPTVRVTRSSMWEHPVNPWKQPDLLPVLSGGLLSELIYAETPRIINDLKHDPNDPAHPFLEGYGSIMAIPHFDKGQGLNMVVLLKREANGFDPDRLAEMVLISNLFGRATHSLALSTELKEAYQALDREMEVVGQMQRSLLPRQLPQIPGFVMAAYYETSRRAGGDYYDFFRVSENKWGIFIADVSGHGTPSAVIMAITHAIAHGYPGQPSPPADLLHYLNRQLTSLYTNGGGTFVTAFYGILDTITGELNYARAGHNPPRLLSGGVVEPLNDVSGLPLGILPDTEYDQRTRQLQSGDQLLFYTDGVTEVFRVDHEMFGTDRLDVLLAGNTLDPEPFLQRILAEVDRFSNRSDLADDRTLIAMRRL